jgi:hypothetical protein
LEELEARALLSATSGFSALVARPLHVVARHGGGFTAAGSPTPFGLTPSQVRQAYGFGAVQGNGSGQTIAIVDAYDDPTIASDLHQFDLAFGLPDPPSLVKLDQNGGTNYPGMDPAGAGNPNGTWEAEESLDVEWAHALAPGANIVLIETQDPSTLTAGVAEAEALPQVTVVSMSWGAPEDSNPALGITSAQEQQTDPLFTTPAGHTGITFLAATGDQGAPGQYPAYSPNVVAVGGTTLSVDAAGNYLGESGWSGSGGGVSQFESQPAYQRGVVTQSTTARTTPDVAFDAGTGVAIYDSYDLGTAGPWGGAAGTSFATPAWAALVALADQARVSNHQGTLQGNTQTLPLLYQMLGSDFHDVTTGSNGFAAGPGYDLVTGRGTPIANLVVTGLQGPQAQVLDGGTAIVNGSGSDAFGSTPQGAPLIRTFTVKNNGGQTLVLSDPISLPAGFALASDFGTTQLAQGASTTFSVRLTAAAAGSYGGTLSFATNDPNSPTFSFSLTGTVTPGAVNGVASTVSLASPTVVSGSTDLATLVVKDVAGDAISGLASSAFRFSLSGGASAGTFGAVTATTTPGTYTAVFTGSTAGTASTLTVTVSGVTLAAQPTITVTPGAVSRATSTAGFAGPTVISGNTDLLTLVIKDAAGNAISGLAGSAFGLSLSGGASAGTFGAVTATATPGTYTAVFTGSTAGTASTLTVTISGVTLTAQPTVTVTPSGASFSVNNGQLTVTGSPLASQNDTITLSTSGGGVVLTLDGQTTQFAPGSITSIVVNEGPGNDTANVEATLANVPATLNLGSGTDAVNISPSAFNLSNVQSLVTVNGRTSSDTLSVYDYDDTRSPVTYALTTTAVTWGGVGVINYNNLGGVALYAGGATVNVESTPANVPVTIDLGSGTQVVNISPTARNLGSIQGNVTVIGGVGYDTLNVDDQANSSAVTYTLNVGPSFNGSSVTRPGSAAIIYNTHLSCGPIAGVVLNGGSGNDTYLVSGTPITPETINAGSGSNTLDLPGPGTAASLLITQSASTGSGKWTFAGNVPLAFSGIQTLNDAGTLTSIQNAAFLSHAYQDLLHRGIDFTGLTGWSAQLTAGLSRTQFALDVLYSTEYVTDLVTADYVKYLHRSPDPTGLSFWVGQLQSGAYTFEQFQASLVASQEYFALHGSTYGGFVQAVYLDVLGRPADPNGLAGWTQYLASGGSLGGVAGAFFGCTEYYTDLVSGYYQQYLHRPADPTGLNYWFGQLQSGAQRDQNLIASLIGSTEYYNDWL